MDTTKPEVPQRERRFWTTLLVFEFLLILATTRTAYARYDALRSFRIRKSIKNLISKFHSL